ncbi:unnamed protein product [Triticum aestivum]|uniref:DUF6598 domain-containing protein n=1 Tax=Triticum aestivum TaxID=4565 RepID=A0A7H4LNN9_WHEAT|nr:unnamed protein product [Triticum aestivum]
MDDIDVGKSAQQIAMEEEEMATEEDNFTLKMCVWESIYGSMGCGRYEDTTLLSSMHFTHLTPIPGLVDGVVRKNLADLLHQTRRNQRRLRMAIVRVRYGCCPGPCRLQPQPSLRLTGPSRAIVFNDPVQFEIQLRVEHRSMTRSRALISATHTFRAGLPGEQTICFENTFCKIELCMELVLESIQATICSVRVVKQGRRQRVEHRCRVACLTTSYSKHVNDTPSGEVVLLDPGRNATPQGSDGYLDLSRRVVSVESEGLLDVVVEAYSSSGVRTAQGHVFLAAQCFGFSQKKFNVDDAELEVTVAWSLLVGDKCRLLRPVMY